MSVAPGMNAILAQLLRRISMACAISVLCDIGGFQTPTDKEQESTLQPYKSHTTCMPAVEDGKLDTFAGSKYMEGETYKREENNKNGKSWLVH
jgi:hypothetical protein